MKTKIYSVAALARKLGVHRSTVHRWILNGSIESLAQAIHLNNKRYWRLKDVE